MTALVHRRVSLRRAGYATPAIVQSNYNLAASGAATATISAATAGNLLVAVVGSSTFTPVVAGSGWTAIATAGSSSARAVLYAKIAAGGETSESTTNLTTNESIWLLEASGVTATATGTPSVTVDSGVAVMSLAVGPTTPTVPGLAVGFTYTGGTATAPAWASSALTLLDGTRVHLGYANVPAGALSSTFSFTGTARRTGGGLAVFAAKTL